MGQFKYPSDVIVDGSDVVYVADGNNFRVQVFDVAGNYQREWQVPGDSPGYLFNTVAAIGVDGMGNVYTLGPLDKVRKFSAAGALLNEWGGCCTGDGKLWAASGMAVDAAGNQYVADNLNNRVQVFDSDGNLLRKWGTSGSSDGQFDAAQDVALGPGGTVYVIDRFNDRVQKFDTAGNFLGMWGSSGTGDTEFDLPTGILAGASGDVYVSEYAGRIKQFDGDGGFLVAWGSYGTGAGQFDVPVGMAFDAVGNLYIVDNNNHRIEKFGPETVATTPATWGRLKAAWR